MESNAAVLALAALAQRHRLAVFRALVARGRAGTHPGELAAELALAPATLSFHLKALAQARLIEAEPIGRQIRYRASFGTMRALLDYLTENCCGGERGACRPVEPAARARPRRRASPTPVRRSGR